ncbi:MAG: hypothetical protein Q9M27_06725 [Mariprofundaceae bacterium]|jgi:hypothetical protein|nr:hypothetical protein [Mariprofundaceae bacterium]
MNMKIYRTDSYRGTVVWEDGERGWVDDAHFHATFSAEKKRTYPERVGVDKAVDICNHSAGSINNKSTPLTPVPLKRLIR